MNLFKLIQKIRRKRAMKRHPSLAKPDGGGKK
jgi:hypothetical protein